MMAKGNAVLKIAGILFIIFGLLNVLWALMYGFLGAIGFDEMGKEILTGLLVLFGVYGVILGLFQIGVGALSFRHSNNPKHWLRCVVWGIVMLVLGVLATVLMFVTSGRMVKGSEAYPAWWGFVIVLFAGIVLPLLMILGGFLNRISAKALKETEAEAVEDAGEYYADPEMEEEADLEPAEDKVEDSAPEEVMPEEAASEEAVSEPVDEPEVGPASADEVIETAFTEAANDSADDTDDVSKTVTAKQKTQPTSRLEFLKKQRLTRNVDPRSARKFGR